MSIPRILPDEYLEGYRGRLALVKGWRSRLAVAERLAEFLGRAGDPDTGTMAFHLLAAAANDLAPVDLVGAHSLLPIAWGIDGPDTRELNDENLRDVDQCLSIYRTHRRSLWLCSACIREDRARHRFSYWHRDHQLPAIHTCLKHGEFLRYVPLRQLIDSLPEHLEGHSVVTPAALPEGTLAPCTGIASAIIRSMANERWTLRRTAAASSLRAAAGRIGLGGGDTVEREQAAARVDRLLPAWWISDALPNLKKMAGPRKHFVDTAMGYSTFSTTVVSIAVTASALFETPDQALAELRAAD